ncbi:heparan-alpha-glucosaminide N-acetyltransferase domain-containing protein [Demequina capsici]|uniref:Heparan-alpha-glucosaminide N-acetyltransferase domain-containing protein n=1 Tax=Demequina capsici TaxID=3075620 RepID=A0AA96F7R3_9MICO|nr:heparan-alpha-glucosaminide N-acetyltransferase domain-containing protein [Demequina sp. OYTSA14]WNM25353.1 heparan-alpha-glucosaminide N-acetyltransferase domain-containing protein [Demequina sp. OYTSA14]
MNQPAATAPEGTTSAPTRVRERIGGLDLARAVAFMGMVAAHIGDDTTRGSDADGWWWLWIVHGRSSALFAVLAGVSIGIMASRAPSRRHTRVKVAVRAVLLVAVGVVVSALGTPVYVILPNLGLMMLLATVALGWRTRWVWAGAVVLLVGGGLAFDPVLRWTEATGLSSVPLVDRLWWHHYPAIVWTGYLLIGLAVSRLPLCAWTTRMRLMLGGTAVGVGVAALGIAADGQTPWPEADATFGWFPAWASMEAHSYSPVELVSNAGVAVASIGLCLWLSDATGPVLAPLRALGSMAFTAYVGHVVVIAIVGDEMVYEPSNAALVVLLMTFTAAAWAWRRRFRQGPLELMMTEASTAVAALYGNPRR